MSTTAPSLTEFAYGSVWLVDAGADGSNHLSPLTVHALGTADVVICDPEFPQAILDVVKAPCYHERAAPERAIERSIKLAQDGWRVVYLVERNAIERAIGCAARVAEHNIPIRIVTGGGKLLIGGAPTGVLFVRKAMSVGRVDTDSLLVVMGPPQSTPLSDAGQRLAPLSFSMPGLAG